MQNIHGFNEKIKCLKVYTNFFVAVGAWSLFLFVVDFDFLSTIFKENLFKI